MTNYRFNATKLMATAFDEVGIKYDILHHAREELLLVPFSVGDENPVFMTFISDSDKNDVDVRVFNLATDIPESEFDKVDEVCKTLTQRSRFFKFHLLPIGDVFVEYDFPMAISDDCVGDAACEILFAGMIILDQAYELLMDSIYTDESPEQSYSISPEAISALSDFFDKKNRKEDFDDFLLN